MKRALFIGRSGCGKTTLSQTLLGLPQVYRKTQSIHVLGDEEIIDTPGEYLERKSFFKALTVTALDCDCIVILLDVMDAQISIPPMIAGIFARPVIGVVSKVDLTDDERVLADAEGNLRMAGCDPVIRVSCKTGQGIEELRQLLS